jgi:novobiocin biosynthesis protein NovU/D-mycarose 3-C-methyltransferase
VEHNVVTVSNAAGVRCLVSGRDDVEAVLDFGALPVAGYLCGTREEALRAPRFPHRVGIGRESEHVQQCDRSARTMLAELVYQDYQPTYSQSRVVSDYVARFVQFAANTAGARKGDTVLEVGSNDGAALEVARARGFDVVGFDPSAKALMPDTGVEFVPAFFGMDIATKWVQGRKRPRVIFSRHTLEHAFDPVDFLTAAGAILDPEGAIVIEVPYLRLQLRGNHFEGMSVQHESFFSIASMLRCLEAAQLRATAVTLVPLDGGSMVITARPREAVNGVAPTPALAALLALEAEEGLTQPRGLEAFRESFEVFKRQVRDALTRAVDDGRRIAAYGAGSKGHQVLNALCLDSSIVSCVVDDTPGKAGKFVPGCGLPVVTQKEVLEDLPDIVLVTAPTHIKELLANTRSLQSAGASFFVTTPAFGPAVSENLDVNAGAAGLLGR